MTFTLYSIGDAAFLEQIINAVAMISGTGDFKKMVSCGLLLGIFAVMFQSLLQGARHIPYQQVFVGWLVYACLFGPTCTVAIEDAYTGQVRVVSHAPLGIGLAGGIISNVGYSLTRLFETAYQPIVPGITSHSFVESLKVLNDVRHGIAQDIGLFNAWDKAIGGGEDGNGVNTRRSWITYMHECTLNKIDLVNSPEHTSVEKLMRQPIDTALYFPSRIHGTRLYLSKGNPQGEDLDCTQAWAKLQEATGYLNSPHVEKYLQEQLGANPFQKIHTALEAVSKTSTATTKYLQTALLEPLYYEAAAGRYRDFQDFSSAMMVEQAIQQRNTQWAGEHSAFMTIFRPITTFFEGFIYAVTPLLAFMIVMGMFGLQLAGRYAQTLLWIQMWMPVLSIINLFIHMAATSAMASYTAAGLDSMYALDHAGNVLQHWIATGGMLAAATPVISLFIVTGSSYAMTSLAGKVVGAEHIEEKIQTPDVTQPAPFLASQSMYKQDSFSGSILSGAENNLATYDFGATASSMVSSAKSVDQQASQNFSHVLSRAFSDNVSQDQKFARYEALDRAFSSQNSEDWQTANQLTKSFMEGANVDSSHARTVRGTFLAQMTGQISAGASFKLLEGIIGRKAPVDVNGNASLSGSLQGSTGSITEDQRKTSSAFAVKFLRGLQSNNTVAQRMQDQLAQGYKTQSGKQFMQTLGNESSQDYRHAAEQKLLAHQSFQKASQYQSQFGESYRMNEKELAGGVLSNPEAKQFLWQKRTEKMDAMSPEQKAVALQKSALLHSHYAGTEPGALGMGTQQASALADMHTFLTPEEKVELASKVVGKPLDKLGDPYAHSHLSEPNVENTLSDAVRKEIGAPPPRFDRNAIAQKAQAPATTDANTMLNRKVPTLTKQHDQQGQQAVKQHAQRIDQQVSAEAERKARWQLMHDLPNRSVSAMAFGAKDNMQYIEEHGLEWVKNLNQALGTGVNAASEGFREESSTLKGLRTALSQGVNTTYNYMREHAPDVRSELQAIGQHRYGLSEKQAAVYATTFDISNSAQKQAVRDLKMDYAPRDSEGLPKLDSAGNPILSEENARFTDSLVGAIKKAAWTGKQAGSYLTPINQYNLTTQPLTSAFR